VRIDFFSIKLPVVGYQLSIWHIKISCIIQQML